MTAQAGMTRSEIFDLGYGEGRMYNTLWDVGREVFRSSRELVDKAKERDEWKKNFDKFRQMVFPPAGEEVVFVARKLVEQEDGELLVCSGIGEDFQTLTSHGSGEATTLLFNSLENLSICDLLIRDEVVSSLVEFKVRRVVGEDLILIEFTK